MKILFVCGRNQWRSPTAERIFKNDPRLDVRSAGVSGKSTNEVEGLLEACLKKRNWLAHSYFSDRSIDFTQTSGREVMIKELEEIQELFRKTDRKISEITEPIMNSYGLTEEKIEEVMKELQTKHKSQSTKQDDGINSVTAPPPLRHIPSRSPE